ncbi:MAG: SufD family Fe-S cluster assembly protein [Rhodocyclaceae bacterium]|nr:SufD family Fe-S cluster assembly protein [Rhodocyclaceae bacterium]
MADLTHLKQAFALIGEDPARVLAPGTAHLIAHGHEIVSQQAIPGVRLEARSEDGIVKARLEIAPGARIAQPIHLCFGLFERFGSQNVDLEVRLGEGARATVWSHCLFTLPQAALHAMNARIELAAGAQLVSNETHYHGLYGRIEVISRATVQVGPRARYAADFVLVQGLVGRLDIDYAVAVAEDGVVELTSKVYGHAADRIRIREAVSLDGARARGLVKTRVAVEDEADADIVGATYGNAAGARGHVDCMEIVRGKATARAVPEVRVSHPEAKVTHEAAIGSVDARQLETLMARGLAPDEAVDRIVLGMLR